jgi:protein translocase SecG subunit
MNQVIFLVQVVIGVLIIAVILLQQKGSGLGSTFGGDVSFYRARRGTEKLLFYTTIFLTVFFVLFSILGLIF